MAGLFGPIGTNGTSLAELLQGLSPPPRPRTFISYHHAGDQWYYDTFSKFFHDKYEAITDGSLERAINSDDDDYTRWRIRSENIKGTSVTIVLCGSQTPWRKHVDWEIKATLDMEHGLVGIRLPTAQLDSTGHVIVPDRLADNCFSGYAVWGTWETATISNLQAWIAVAKGRPAATINNSRAMRQRNG
jgi:hypothetical protein